VTNFSFQMGNAVRGQPFLFGKRVPTFDARPVKKRLGKSPTVDTLLSLAKLYFDIYTGFSAPSCERLADTYSCISNLSTTSLKELFVISYRHLKSLARWQADVSHHMTAQGFSSSLVPDIEQRRLKEQIPDFRLCGPLYRYQPTTA
jgi:hypothetical protein